MNKKDIEQQEITQDSKNIVMLIWIGTLFFGFIPGLIGYLIKKDDSYIQEQSKEALNWSIIALIVFVLSSVALFIGILIEGAILICHLVICIMGAVAASDGKSFKVPLIIPIIK